MNIAFDGVNIDTNYVTGIFIDGKAFNDEDMFKLGSTICRTVSLRVSNDLATTPNSVVTIQGVNYCIDNIKKSETDTTYLLIDNMVLLNFRYDAQPLINASSHTESSGKKYVTLLELAQDICTKAGLTLATTNFDGYDKHISWWDNTITAREYISMIAELNSGYAITNGNNLYFYRYNESSIGTILLEDCSDYQIGEKHKITRIVMDNGTFTPVGSDTGNTIYLNPNNVFITDQTEIQRIYNKLNNIEFYSLKADKGDIIATHIDNIGKWITFSLNNINYMTLNQINGVYNGGWNGSYHFIVGSNQQEETVVVNGVEENYTRLKTQVDYDKNQIGLLAETKVNNSDYKKATIVAMINDNTQSQIKIEADSIDLNGVVTANGNFKINLDGSMEATAGKFGYLSIVEDGLVISRYTAYNYTESDVTRCQQIVNGQITPTQEDYDKYDMNKNGQIQQGDVGAIQRLIDWGVTTTTPINLGLITGGYGQLTSLRMWIGDPTDRIRTHSKVLIEPDTAWMDDFYASNISAGNMDCGDGYATKVGNTVYFNKTFSSVPKVVATPVTSTNGVIALKITNVTTTDFTVMTGGSTDFGNVNINWIAMN